MYQPAFPHIAWLVTVAGFGAIIIGVLFWISAALQMSSPCADRATVLIYRRLAWRFILGGVAVLVGFGIWRLI